MSLGQFALSIDESKNQRRRYPSTIVVGVVTLSCLLLLNLPGRVVIEWDLLSERDKLNPKYPRFEHAVKCHHGWPLTFLERNALLTEGTPPVSRYEFWDLSHRPITLGKVALLFDLVFASLGIWFTCLLYQRWRKRRASLLQLHVIDAMVIALSVAIMSGILRYNYNVLAYEHRALESMAKRVTDSVTWGNRPIDRVIWRPSRVAWVKDLKQHEYVSAFDRAVGFTVSGPEIPYLQELKDLQFVEVRGSVSNRHLQDLQQLPRLRILDLSVSELVESSQPNESLILPPMPKLRALNFGGSAPFSGDGLGGLRDIVVLDLSGTQLNDEGLSRVAELKHLRHLYLDGTQVTNTGLRQLSKLPRLERLSIRFVPVNEEGLRHLAKIQTLRQLYLFRIAPLSKQEQMIVAAMNLESETLGMPSDEELRQIKDIFPERKIW